MSAQDTERAAALERRYRRLLRCYPPFCGGVGSL